MARAGEARERETARERDRTGTPGNNRHESVRREAAVLVRSSQSAIQYLPSNTSAPHKSSAFPLFKSLDPFVLLFS